MDASSANTVTRDEAPGSAGAPVRAGLSEITQDLAEDLARPVSAHSRAAESDEPVVLVDDPRAWWRFAHEIVSKHHRVHRPGIQAEQCSCGRPLMLCSIALLAERLVHRGPR